jgi:hypothetical protein
MMMTKFEAAKKHIELREAFYEVKYNPIVRAYAHIRMYFVKEESIVGANKTLESYIKSVGTAAKLRETL